MLLIKSIELSLRSTTRISSTLVVSDKDTVQVNRRLKYTVLNDSVDLYDVMCIKRPEKYEDIPDFKTGVYCSEFSIAILIKQLLNIFIYRIQTQNRICLPLLRHVCYTAHHGVFIRRQENQSGYRGMR